MAKFVALIRFGSDTEKRLAVRPTHREYLKSLFDSGKLHESGPYIDDSGALIIYEAADEAEAREILANDPYSPAGIIESVEIKEWNRVFPPPSA